MKPEISVIVHRFNYARHLERCLQSVMTQTVKNIELIMISDSRMNQDMQIVLERFANGDQRICLLRQTSDNEEGMLTQAIEACQGRYILISAADMYYPYDALETMLANAGPDGLVFNYVYKNCNGDYEKAIQTTDTLSDALLTPSIYNHLFSARVFHECSVCLYTTGFYRILEGLLNYYSCFEQYKMLDEVLAYRERMIEKSLYNEYTIHASHLKQMARLQMDQKNLNAVFLTIGTLLIRLNTEACSCRDRGRRSKAFQCMRDLAEIYCEDTHAAAYFRKVLGFNAGLLSALQEDFYFYAFRQEEVGTDDVASMRCKRLINH